MAKVTFSFVIEASWETLIETGEILNKDASLSLSIFSSGKTESHKETIVAATVEGKKVWETWDRACAVDVNSLEEVKAARARYPVKFYFISAGWQRVK
jgi:hypothetical protein